MRHSKRKITINDRNQVVRTVSDPQSAYLIYELDKGTKLREIAAKHFDFSSFKKRIESTGESILATKFYLILKQERGGLQGQRILKGNIDAFKDRIVGPGWLYLDGHEKPFKYQSLNLIKSKKKYSSAIEFAEKSLSSKKLPPDEVRRASLVALPVITRGAFYFPQDTSSLDELNRDHMDRWIEFLDLHKNQYHDLFIENEVRFIDLMNWLTLDILVTGTSPSEERYLNDITKKLLNKLGIKRILQIESVPQEKIVQAMKSIKVPDIHLSDYAQVLEFYNEPKMPFNEFVEKRMNDLAIQMRSHAAILNSL